MHHSPRIIFAGGGTAGHLFPGLAVAQRLQRLWPQARITFVGSGRGIEARHVAAAGYEFIALPCRPLPRRWGDLLPSLIDNLAGYRAALRLLAQGGCAAVVGLGGYASVPAARAALDRRVPLLLLEQNVMPGRATRWLARRARLVCLAFAETVHFLPPWARVAVTGTPLRQGFERFATPGTGAVAASNGIPQRQILVLGGSGGAQALNEQVPRALDKLRTQLAGWRIVHQAGPLGVPATADLYRKLALDAQVEPFLTDMPAALAQTSLVIGRAGGTTLAELAVAGVPAVLIPYPHATDDHQLHNAQHAARSGAALIFDQRTAAAPPHEPLASVISALLDDPLRRQQMAQAMRTLARPQAAEHVATAVRDLVLSNAARAAA